MTRQRRATRTRRQDVALRLGLLFALSFTSFGAAGRGEASHPAARTQVIGGQTIDTDEFAATGALVRKVAGAERAFVCTGTLIAPRFVLTAAHCVPAGGAQTLVFAFGANPVAPEREVTVSRALPHPSFAVTADGESAFHDIALVGLAEPVSDVRPELLQTDGPQLGALVDLVGYGSTVLPPQRERIKNAGQSSITAVLPTELAIGELGSVQNCVGDSGGPAFATDELGERRLVSVTSRSTTAAEPCQKGAIHTRVDAHLAFIREVMSETSEQDASAACALASWRARSGPSAAIALGLFAFLRMRRRGRRATATAPSWMHARACGATSRHIWRSHRQIWRIERRVGGERSTI